MRLFCGVRAARWLLTWGFACVGVVRVLAAVLVLGGRELVYAQDGSSSQDVLRAPPPAPPLTELDESKPPSAAKAAESARSAPAKPVANASREAALGKPAAGASKAKAGDVGSSAAPSAPGDAPSAASGSGSAAVGSKAAAKAGAAAEAGAGKGRGGSAGSDRAVRTGGEPAAVGGGSAANGRGKPGADAGAAAVGGGSAVAGRGKPGAAVGSAAVGGGSVGDSRGKSGAGVGGAAVGGSSAGNGRGKSGAGVGGAAVGGGSVASGRGRSGVAAAAAAVGGASEAGAAAQGGAAAAGGKADAAPAASDELVEPAGEPPPPPAVDGDFAGSGAVAGVAGTEVEPQDDFAAEAQEYVRPKKREYSVRIDLLNWLLLGRLSVELEMSVWKYLTVSLTPVFVVARSPIAINYAGLDDPLTQRSHGIGPLSGVSLGVGAWFWGEPFKGYVVRLESTNYGYSYRTADGAGVIDRVDFTERRLILFIGSHSRFGAFTFAGGFGLGYELNQQMRCGLSYAEDSGVRSRSDDCKGKQQIALDREIQERSNLNGPLHPVYFQARFSLGVVF